MSPRTGRPTDNPKGKPITIRLDNEAKTILDSYCLQENVDKGEAVRRGIKKLKEDLTTMCKGKSNESVAN